MVLERVIKPYPYQVPVISTVKATLVIRDFVLFVMAMGLGKTVTSAFIVEDYLREGKRGLFLCHETYILEQVEQEYRNVLGDDLVYKTFYGSEKDGKKDWAADQADMLFASFQSMNNWHEKWYLAFDPDHFDFMVVDESHHGQAPSYKEVINYFQCKKIGMTATPDRMDLKDIREIFGEEVYTITLEQGIANGWLAGIEYHVLSDGINNTTLKKICKEVLEGGKRVSVKQLNETIFIKERDKAEKEIIDEYSKIREFSGDRKTLLFCERTAHADKLVPHFNKSGVMHSKKTSKENNNVFNAFKSGDLQYVASVNKFNEGKHVPGVEVIVFLRATDSLTIFWQQLGRALAKLGNKEKIIVLDFVSNLERLVQVRDLMLRTIQVKNELDSDIASKLPLDVRVLNVSGENFEFIFSDELVDVMKIIEALRKGFYENWEEASQAAIKLGFSGKNQYTIGYRQDLRLPAWPSRFYPDFPGWRVFLGNRDTVNYYQNWQEAAIAVTSLGIRGSIQYYNNYRQDPRLPASLEGSYKDFPGWGIFLGKSLRPEGWLSLKKTSELLNLSRDGIVSFVEGFRKSNPEWFKSFWVGNQNAEHFHPDLVKKIAKLGERKLPLLGWRASTDIVSSLKSSRPTFLKFIKPFREQNPEWFIDFDHPFKYGETLEYYASDLVERFEDFLKSKIQDIPLGWLTPNALEKKEKVSSWTTIKKFIKPFREENPEWFRFFWLKGTLTEHYHPDLVQKIKEHFAKKNRE